MEIVTGIESLCDSKLWDINTIWNTTSPELSSCLNDTLIVWIPALFLWIFVPYLVFDFITSNRNSIDWNYYNIIRLSLAIICTSITLVDCILCLLREYQWDDSSTLAHILSTVIHFVTRLLLCIIFYCHKICGIHISGIVWFHLLFDSVLSALSVTTYTQTDIRQNHEYILLLIEFSLTVALLIICSFPDKLPPNDYSEDFKGKICPKEKVSFPSRLTFWWLNSLMINGWRRSLTIADLWDVRREDRCISVFRHFNKYWNNSKYNEEPVVGVLKNGEVSYEYKSISNLDQSVEKKKKTNVMVSIWKSFWAYFLIPNILKLFSDIVQLSNPMILKLLIGFTVNISEPEWHGYIYALLFIFTNIFQSLINAYQSQRMAVLGMRIRTCLVSAVYRKSLILSNYAKKETTTGEIVNLMAVDSQRFIDLLPWLSFLWTAPIQIAIAMWLLYNELGPSCFGGLIYMIAIVPINGFVAGKVKQIQTNQMALKDQRLKAMNEILSGIKVLKLYAWEEAFIENILGIRTKELGYLRKSGFLGCIFVCIASSTPFVVSLISFAIYINIDGNILDAQKAFVSIALFNLLRIPLTMIPNMISSLILTMVSVKRLNKFLNFDELNDYVTRNIDKEIISIESGTFTWDRIEDIENGLQPTLENINLKVEKGKFVAIVGSVGSGKSSLLYSLLGEMEKASGNINIDGNAKIAYVPQQAWIQNATVRDNILFGQDFNMKKYRKVIRSCALKQDLLVLSAGDETEIGEKGINLSGGQKQRVSLARACYSDSDLFFFDDPLSAVDSHVGKHIFDEVLSSKTGLLHNKTRILVTNSLFVLPNVDLIVVLKNGKVSDIGTYDNLMTKKGDFAELINQYSSNKTDDKEEEESEPSIEMRRRASTAETPLRSTENSKLVETEKAETGEVKFAVYKKLVKAMSLFWTIAMVFNYAAMNTASTGSSFWLSAWTNDKDHSKNQSAYRLGIYALIGCFQILFICIAWLSIVCGSLLASSSLHQKLLEKIMHAPMHFFDTTPLGRLLNRFSKDIDILDVTIQLTMRVLMNTTFQILAIIVTISIQTPLFIAVVVPIMVLYYFIQKFYVVTSRQLKRLESITRSPIYSHFSETINGVSSIRAYGVNQRFIHKSDERVDINQVCFYPSAVANCWLQVRLEFLANCLIFFSALFAVISRGKLDGGETGLSISYSLNITLCLNWCVRMFAEMENNVVAVERIDEYCTIDSEAEWYSDKKPEKDWPQSGSIEFIEYGTKYRPGLDLVLKGIDLSVTKGEKIGIVGRTGAGKSSLTLALFRLIEATYGRIVIDGIDISKLGLQELRSKLTIIPQDPVLFSGTLRTNLDPFQKSSDDELWTALDHSHLKSFVKSLEIGLDHKVSEGGENLSVGQRQLICLARALLRKTNILILDEATAAIDLETDALIQTTIKNEFSRCTVLTIAHRLNTILDSDRVLVLDQGKVAEFDSPQNLLKNENTMFYSLAKDAGLV